MSSGLLTDVTMFVLAVLVGFEVISKVPATLHTPLMSGANSIHGIILLGVVIVAGSARTPVEYALVAVAAAFATANVVGGYLVTDRMLEMFRTRDGGRGPAGRSRFAAKRGEAAEGPAGRGGAGGMPAPRNGAPGDTGAGPAGAHGSRPAGAGASGPAGAGRAGPAGADGPGATGAGGAGAVR